MQRTIEEVRALSDDELRNIWGHYVFPFESMKCGCCITQHAKNHNTCHPQVTKRAKELKLNTYMFSTDESFIPTIRSNLDAIFALRSEFSDLYRQPIEAK